MAMKGKPLRFATRAQDLQPIRPPAFARQSASKRGYDRTWQRFREWYASVEPPICSVKTCRHAGTNSEMHLDHITPLAMGGERCDPNNVQWLCQACHSRKTAQEDGAFGRRRKARQKPAQQPAEPTRSTPQAGAGGEGGAKVMRFAL